MEPLMNHIYFQLPAWLLFVLFSLSSYNLIKQGHITYKANQDKEWTIWAVALSRVVLALFYGFVTITQTIVSTETKLIVLNVGLGILIFTEVVNQLTIAVIDRIERGV